MEVTNKIITCSLFTPRNIQEALIRVGNSITTTQRLVKIRTALITWISWHIQYQQESNCSGFREFKLKRWPRTKFKKQINKRHVWLVVDYSNYLARCIRLTQKSKQNKTHRRWVCMMKETQFFHVRTCPVNYFASTDFFLVQTSTFYEFW